MRLKRHAPLLQSTLKRVAHRSLAPSLCIRCRRYASSTAYPENIAVLGGGISGLASAYFASKEFPNSKITLYEAGNETGGWIRSKRVDVPGGNVLFESGPRTLRPGINCLPAAGLIQDLGLLDNVIYTHKKSPGAKNRFLYYPDQLNRLPSPGEPPNIQNIFQLVRNGVFNGAAWALLEAWRPRRSSNMTDESVGSFIARRADKRIANTLVSAVMHGIYAGDVWQLSARTLLPGTWRLEGMYGSVWTGMSKINQGVREQMSLFSPIEFGLENDIRRTIRLEDKFVDQLEQCTTFTLRNGLQELVKGLQRNLEENEQVEIKLDSPVRSYKLVTGEKLQVEVTTGTEPSQTKQSADIVISSLQAPALTDFVTVMTVNLFFPKPYLVPVQGFGYLIPQNVPFEQNPERALGVIFDSDAVVGQDTTSGTKLTVMLGGHWWNSWEHYPDESEGLELARSVIERHLGITEEPAAYNINLSKDCIPQYTVGYQDRLKDYAETLKDDFRGRVRVVGNQFGGVGVNDCIKGAWSLVRELRDDGWKDRKTGLERMTDEREWIVAPASHSSRMRTPKDAYFDRD